MQANKRNMLLVLPTLLAILLSLSGCWWGPPPGRGGPPDRERHEERHDEGHDRR